MVGIIITLFILSVLVLIHEFGHFIVGKKLGIKVEEFGFGFPPKLWGKKVGETLYTINWLPIGGFVKLFGEDEAGAGRISTKSVEETVIGQEDLKRAFFTRPVWQRAAVVVAGVVMNALLAFIIYYVFMAMTGFRTELPLLSNHTFFLVDQVNFNTDETNPVITYVSPNSPADKIGMKAPSKIISVDNKPVKNTEETIKAITKFKGKEVSVTWVDVYTDQNRIMYRNPQKAMIAPRANPPENEGPTGIAFLPVAHLLYETPVQKVLSGIVHPLNLMSYNFDVLGNMIVQSINKRDASALSQGVSGPVGIVSLGGSINKIPDLKERFLQFLNLAGILSISLAFFNILPIPALDGGRLFFILLEGVTGKKVSPKIEGYIHTIGMTILIGLVLLVTFKDILQIFAR